MVRLVKPTDVARLSTALNEKSPEREIIVSRGTCGCSRGAEELTDALRRELSAVGTVRHSWSTTATFTTATSSESAWRVGRSAWISMPAGAPVVCTRVTAAVFPPR